MSAPEPFTAEERDALVRLCRALQAANPPERPDGADAGEHFTVRQLLGALVLAQQVEPMPFPALRDGAGFGKAATSRLIDTLTRRGFADRSAKADRRTTDVAMTPAGVVWARGIVKALAL